jgi:hypothetical protein
MGALTRRPKLGTATDLNWRIRSKRGTDASLSYEGLRRDKVGVPAMGWDLAIVIISLTTRADRGCTEAPHARPSPAFEGR